MSRYTSANPYIQSLINRIVAQSTDGSMSEWICNHTTIKGGEFSFKNRLFQKEILDDMHPNLCVKKLSQVGLTEGQIRKAIGFMVKNGGCNVLYTFPTSILKKNNSKTRIRPVVDTDFPPDESDKPVRNEDIIQIGNSFMYIASGSESDVTSTPADMVLNDEVDLGDNDFYALVNSRLQASPYKIKQNFSTPTFSGYGISLDYENSDQREYFIKCPHCNEWQVPGYDLRSVFIPDLPSYIQRLTDIKEELAIGLDLDSAYVRCIKCGHKLDLSDDAKREWIAKYPTRLHSRGYQVRPFSSNLLSVKYLVMTMADYIKKGRIRRGYNTVLGEDYQDANSRMEEKVIRACFRSQDTPYISPTKPVSIGIDMGLTCHITLAVDGAFILFKQVGIDQLDSEVDYLFSQYNIVAGAIDRYPYTPNSNALRDKTNGIIQPVVFSGSKVAAPAKETDGTINYFLCNRTSALDRVKSAIYRKNYDIYGYGSMDSIIVEHLRDMVRESSEIGKEPEWKKLNGNDHFFFSMCYALLAKEIKYSESNLNRSETRSVISACIPQVTDKNLKKPVDNLDLVGYSKSYSRYLSI